MSELGNELKQARVDKQLSLEDLQRTTKIQKRYLVAIEEGRFDSLPGMFYARAFVKTYADAVGLDSTELLETHKNELPKPSKSEESIPSRSERRKTVAEAPAKKSRAVSFIPLISIIVFVIVIVAAIFLIQSSLSGNNDPVETDNNPIDAEYGDPVESEDESENEEPSEEEQTEDENQGSTDAEEEETEPEESVSELTLDESTGNTSFFTLEADTMNVRIEFAGDSYADIKDGSGEFLIASSLFQDGDDITEDYSDEESILINLGASQNATVFINDEEVELPLDVVHQKLEISYQP
ncbi:helix-turn-helix domain-containing protein [Alkalihalobacillus sp. FSL R5-0424]